MVGQQTAYMASTALHRMIRSQADALERVADLNLSRAALTLADAERIVLVGTGTSQHAAELGAQMFEEAGVEARWSSGSQFCRGYGGARPGDAVVVISHTAETSYAIRSRSESLETGVGVVSVTGVGRGWPEAIETVPAEESETYTVSYTAALGVLAGLAHRLGSPHGSIGDLKRVAAQVREVCAAPGIGEVGIPARSLAIIGPGPWGVTAREGALKIREAARVLAEGFESERFLHGAAVPYTAADGLLILEPGADTDGLTAALGVAAGREGMVVETLSAGDGLPALLAQIPMTVRLQLLAESFATMRRQNPDEAIVGAWADSELWRLGAH
jgi:glutamine---fructose-6-phosphate transaminase (isomerizing)